MMSGPIVAMVWEGFEAAKTGRLVWTLVTSRRLTFRSILGATKPSDSAPGTIRGDFAQEVG